VLRRSTTSTSTTIIVYAFGLEEHQYSGSGTNQWNTYYYSLAGHLIGALDGNGTTFYLTDALGSILTSFNNTASSASVKGEQSCAPYGTAQYYQGNLNTPKGFTGQYNDALTGLDYFNARYYDPVVGVFLSADTVEGDMQGMNPYAYVGGNPETRNDPTGLRAISACPTNNCNTTVNWAALTFEIENWAAGYTTSTTTTPVTTATQPTVTSISSCGAPTQGTCGQFGAYLALYFGPFQIGVPVEWCVDCWHGGGSRGSDETGSVTGGVLASDTGEGGVTLPEGSSNVESDGGITSIGRSLIQDLLDQGVTVVQNDPEANAWLNLNDAKGVTWFNGVEGDAGPHTTTVILGDNANDSTVYEEWLHVLAGSKRGWLGNDVEQALAEEIQVNLQLLANAEQLGMTDKEIRNIQLWLSNQKS
jgi:RHS repeat-associated protein